MTLHNVVLFGLLLWFATNVMWAAFFISAIAELSDRVKKTRKGLRHMAEAIGFEYESHHNGDIFITLPWDTSILPATRQEVETFFKDNNERLAAVYQHLGIKVAPKVTPAVPAKREIVVEKVVKK